MALPLKQIGLTAGAAGVAAAAVVGAWGAWSTGDAQNQDTRAGVLDFDFGAGSITTTFGEVDDPIAPGDSGCRAIALVNDGNVDFTNFRLYVEHALTEGNYTDSVGNGTSDGKVIETVTSDEDDLLTKITISVDYKDAGNAAVNASTDCSAFDALSGSAAKAIDTNGNGVSTDAMDGSTTLANIDSTDEADEVNVGDGVGEFVSNAANLGSQDTAYLKLGYAYASDAAETSQNVYGTLTWVFEADQRGAVTTQ